MTSQREIGIGVVGAGFLAETRARCYGKVAANARITGVASKTADKASAYAAKHTIPFHTTDYAELLARDDVHVVDLCVPNDLHRPMTEAAARAGKHVVCTKPLTAYVGQDLGPDAEDAAISARDRATMLELATADASAMLAACRDAGVQLMYGENWVYAPAIARAVGLLERSGGTVLDMRGGESHNGSHSPFSKLWRYTGGGALLRLGAHPIGAMLYCKRREGLARDGQPIRPVAVTAEVGDLSRIESVAAESEEYIVRGWQDVENWGTAIITFADGSRGVAWGADTLLGGMQSALEISMSNARLVCNLSPNDLCRVYAPDASVFGDDYLIEKASTTAGWHEAIPDEDWSSGQLPMCEDFVRAVAEGRPALSDGELGVDVVEVVYAAYLAASEGRRVELGRGSA